MDAERQNLKSMYDGASADSASVIRSRTAKWWMIPKWSRHRKSAAAFLVFLFLLLIVPVPAHFRCRRTISCDLQCSFTDCCWRLSDEKLQIELLQSAGGTLKVRKVSGGLSDALLVSPFSKDGSWLKDGLSVTGTLTAQGDSDLGPLSLELRQETILRSDSLQVETRTTRPDRKLEHYFSLFSLIPDMTHTKAEVTIEIQVRLFTPLCFRYVAWRHLNWSVGEQLKEIRKRLQKTLNRE